MISLAFKGFLHRFCNRYAKIHWLVNVEYDFAYSKGRDIF